MSSILNIYDKSVPAAVGREAGYTPDSVASLSRNHSLFPGSGEKPYKHRENIARFVAYLINEIVSLIVAFIGSDHISGLDLSSFAVCMPEPRD